MFGMGISLTDTTHLKYVTVYSNVADDSDEEDNELDDMAWEVSSDAGLAGKNTDDSGAISDVPGLPAALVPVPAAIAPPTLNLPTLPGPSKVQVVVRDVAYVTYKAFLYYVSVSYYSIRI